ncbi:MAG TPA: hypothetical protein VEL75_22400, partial [Candidatus Methylomirabilis sp.]|nr:hypothetical protein [Candidatus Methylomirabilis sp.]
MGRGGLASPRRARGRPIAPSSRWWCLALLTALIVGFPALASAISRPPSPVIFVHGIASDSSTWDPLSAGLTSNGWVLGGHPVFDPATAAVSGVLPGDFYTMNFSDATQVPFKSQSLGVDQRGYELAAIILAVLNANPGATQVILVAHSMGGLAARDYLEGLARPSAAVGPIPYRGDVAQLIVIGTPSLGSPLALFCQTLPQACLAIAIDPSSNALMELVPGSPSLTSLNDFAANPLPLAVRYESIAGLGGVGPAGDGDGVVPRASEEFLATVPGLSHILDDLVIPLRADCGHAIGAIFVEVHTCEPGDSGVGTAIVDTILNPRLGLSLNRATATVGDTLTVTLTSQPGLPEAENIGDLYIGVFVPGGAVYLLTPTGLVLAFDGVNPVPGGLQAFRVDTELTSSSEVVLSATAVSPIPDGPYTFFAVLVRTGTTPADQGNWLSNAAEATMT